MLLNPLTVELTSMCRRPVTAALRMRAAFHLLDWLGCAIYGLRYLHGKALLGYLKDVPEGKASALGAGRKHFEQAAFHNACLGNIAEMDDVHRTSILHPGPVVIPAALAVAEHTGASGAQFLDAIVRGYEVMIRIGEQLGPKHYAFFHNTSTAGAFGAAAAAADLLELNDEQFAWALGNAGTRTGGFWQMRHEPCMAKSLHNGLAAQSGLLAALLAKRNFTGPKYILEGPQGLFPAIAPDGNPIEIIFDPEGAHKISEVSFKPWPACRHAHPAIDAALKVKAKLPAGSVIAKVSVETYADAIKFCDKPSPKTELEAKFSLQHSVAVALIKNKPGLDDFTPPFDQAKIIEMRGKVSIKENAELTRVYPKNFAAIVGVTLQDGSEYYERVMDAWGDPAWPLSISDLEAKFSQLLQRVGVLPSRQAEIVMVLKQLPDARNLSDFSKVLQRVEAG
jgi:2-methylcitrate dehydratase PrpD